MNVLEKIDSYAADAHANQMRQFEDAPYIVHLRRVKSICQEYTSELPILAAALLHDVLEDTDVTKHDLYDFLNTVMNRADADKTIKLVGELTDEYVKENYPQWNRRKRKDKEATRLSAISAEGQTVKYADIIDNSLSLPESGEPFTRKYLYEVRALLRVMNRGNAELLRRANETVFNEIAKVAG